jgi:hypothetical protein
MGIAAHAYLNVADMTDRRSHRSFRIDLVSRTGRGATPRYGRDLLVSRP